MNKNLWTTFVITMEADEENQKANGRRLESLTNHFETALKELIEKYNGRDGLAITLREDFP